MVNQRIVHIKYENLVSKLLNGERLPQEASGIDLL
jgi:serine/threonine-protein kinase mTOR